MVTAPRVDAVGGSSESVFARMLEGVAQFPGVRIDRTAYLRKSLRHHCSEAQIHQAIEKTPADAGVSLELIGRIADESIRHESTKVTGLSVAAGLPGGFALIGTIPADSAQYLAHMLRVAQKLAYLYSWPELFSGEGEEIDDGTQNVLVLFVGVMFGVQAANKGVTLVAAKFAEQVVRQLPRQALTKGVVYPIVKAVAGRLGVEMTKGVFAKGVSKAIPILGGLISGGLTLATFLPMSKRLQRHLSALPSAAPSTATLA